ncbi:uncharacterized protein LOC110273583 [Arachis duranensis]|uniref:Uncharacterized protein LOC110273583 n=1 Tax=Arachis duranensis TaxID=130453 RepID=A0A6P5MI03_ARADU|nr:uncharacterized protein LOC110273583 [Arachis duranensis]
MGFGSRWRAWIRECITSTSISILINGSPTKPFKMKRGLRQRDPLSPFLFVLVVDVLNKMIGEAVRNRRISPLLVGSDNIELWHLQFVDNTILFCPPEEDTVRNYQRLLRCFEIMSGLSINFDKSNLIPVNCSQEWPVIDNVEEKLSLWKSKVLSKAGKLRRFFWGKEDGQPGMALVKWEMVQAPKKLGDYSLWKKIVCSCNNLKPDHLLSTQALPVRGDPWRDICQLRIKDQHARQKMIDGLAMEEQTMDDEILNYRFANEIWKGLVPPKVELFTWFILIGRVNTKERLRRFGIIEGNDNLCVLCKKEVETVQHLFVTYEYSWQVWIGVVLNP